MVLVIISAGYAWKPESIGSNRGDKGTRPHSSSLILKRVGGEEESDSHRVHGGEVLKVLASLMVLIPVLWIPEEKHKYNLALMSGEGQVGGCHCEVRVSLYLTRGRGSEAVCLQAVRLGVYKQGCGPYYQR